MHLDDNVSAPFGEFVNIMFETTLPILSQQAPSAPKPKISLRKTPTSIMTMKQHVNTAPSPFMINLQDLVINAPLGTAKPGEQISKLSVSKLFAPPKPDVGASEEKASKTNVSKQAPMENAPKILQPLASLTPSAPVQSVKKKVAAAAGEENFAPHN